MAMEAQLLRLQFVRGPPTRVPSGEDVDFILTVTDDLGAEVYFGDLPLPLAVHVQCRVLDRWHALPPAVFALSAKTERELSPFIAGRGQPVAGRFTDALWRELRSMGVKLPSEAEVRLHICAGEREGFGWREAAAFCRFHPAPCRRLAGPSADTPHEDATHRSNAKQRSTKRRRADDREEKNGKEEREEEEKEEREEEEGEEQYVVLPLLSSAITVTRLASASKAGKGGTTLDRSRTIEREVPLQDDSGRFVSVREEYGTFLGSHLWDGALASSYLLCHVNARFPSFLLGKRVLELGSGCGLMGLTAAMLGAHVTMTDLGEVIPTLRANVERNLPGCPSARPSALACGNVEVMELDWTDDAALRRTGTEAEWDLIVASDVMYSDTVFGLFFRALTAVLGLAAPDQAAAAPTTPLPPVRARSRRTTRVLVGHKVRCEDERGYFDTIRQVFNVTLVGRAFRTNVYLWEVL